MRGDKKALNVVFYEAKAREKKKNLHKFPFIQSSWLKEKFHCSTKYKQLTRICEGKRRKKSIEHEVGCFKRCVVFPSLQLFIQTCLSLIVMY